MERAYKLSGALMLDTDVNGESVLIDVGSVWGETFAHWDCLVSADLAAEIATATAAIVRRHAEKATSRPKVKRTRAERARILRQIGAAKYDRDVTA